jgi:hypothetical protein
LFSGGFYVAKKGIKIKELARELGITSRQLIDECRSRGVPAQNSITVLRPPLDREVRGWFVDQPDDEGPTGIKEGGAEAEQ